MRQQHSEAWQYTKLWCCGLHTTSMQHVNVGMQHSTTCTDVQYTFLALTLSRLDYSILTNNWLWIECLFFSSLLDVACKLSVHSFFMSLYPLVSFKLLMILWCSHSRTWYHTRPFSCSYLYLCVDWYSFRAYTAWAYWLWLLCSTVDFYLIWLLSLFYLDCLDLKLYSNMSATITLTRIINLH
jgi:hypothetical protein